MAAGKLHNKALNQSVYNDEAIDAMMDEFDPIPDTFLRTTDVINNLTSNEATKPLSANQGRLLEANKARYNGGNTFTGEQTVQNSGNPVQRTRTNPGMVSVEHIASGQNVLLHSSGIDFNSMTLERVGDELHWNGKPLGEGNSLSVDGEHLRIDDFESYEDNGYWAIRSNDHQFDAKQLYAVHLSIGNQGGQSEGIALLGVGRDSVGLIWHGSGSPYHLEATIENGEIHFYNLTSGQNGLSVYQIIRIGAHGGGAAVFGKIFELERFTFSAGSLTYVGWRRTDGEQLEEEVEYTLKGTYYGDAFELTLDENGWGELPNGMSVQIGQTVYGMILIGGSSSQYNGIEIFSAAEPGAIAPPIEPNVDAMSALWMGNKVLVKFNENLMSMMGLERMELSFNEVPNTQNIEELQSHLTLDQRLFEPMDDLLQAPHGMVYGELEQDLRDITNYCEQYGWFDMENVDDWDIYYKIQNLFEALNMIDMIDPKLMSLKMDFSYATENDVEVTVSPIGLSGTKGMNEVIVPYIREKRRLV